MSDKRFSETERNCYYTSLVFDNKIQEKLGTTKAVDLLNEQQDTINDLNGELEESSAFIIEQRKEIQTLKEENKYLKKRIKVISDELYCKDRKLEELGVSIECCDKR